LAAIHVAERVRRIKPSPSTAAAERADQLRRAGRSIVNLTVGEPDFDTPEPIRRAAAKAMEAGATRYTALAGTIELRRAIARKLARDHGLEFAPDQIVVTNGAKSAIFAAFAATLEPGDEVLIPAPYWVSYPDAVLACDGVPVALTCPEEAGFELRPEQLEAAIGPKTRWLVLNSPANPTGATYDLAAWRGLARVLARHPQVSILTDDIYEHIHFAGGIAPHLLEAAPELRDRTLAVNGVSKTYAMTGWRIGWAAGPRELVSAIATLLSQSAGNACSVSQAAAVEALTGDQSFIERWLAIYRERRDRTLEGLARIPGLSCRSPEGAFYLFVSCAGLIGARTAAGKTLESDRDVVLWLLEEAGVAVVAGEAYGLSPYFRLSIATALETLDEGVRRIARAVATLR
jgi:aspartate aminotransferase